MMFNISLFTTKRNKKSDRKRYEDALRTQLEDYLYERNICMGLDDFADSVRNFFDESQEHHERIAYRDAIAAGWGLDMTIPRNRDELWRRIANGRRRDRKTRIKWLSHETDPTLDQIRIYFRSLRVNCNLPPIDDVIAPVRTGIARTLTYIRVFPPSNSGGDVTDAKPEIVKQCREQLRRHVHYRNHRNLNQHALDWVRDEYHDAIWIDADTIGALRCRVEHDPSDFLFAPWIIFKFATFADIDSSNKPKANPCVWIWDDSHPRHADLWRL